jgi:hypothetical protein
LACLLTAGDIHALCVATAAVYASWRQPHGPPGRLWRWQAPIAQRIERLPPKQ